MTLKLLLAGKNEPSFQPIRSAIVTEDILTITASTIAMAVYLARKNQPHLILCQPQLIDGDGLTLFSEIKYESDLSNIPFAFMLTSKQAQADLAQQMRDHAMKDKVNCLILEEYDQLSALKQQLLLWLRVL